MERGLVGTGTMNARREKTQDADITRRDVSCNITSLVLVMTKVSHRGGISVLFYYVQTLFLARLSTQSVGTQLSDGQHSKYMEHELEFFRT